MPWETGITISICPSSGPIILVKKGKFRTVTAPITILGLEASCDETAASVIRRHRDGSSEILSNIVLSQIEEHAAFGGVVPEIAARAHVDAMDGVVKAALEDAAISLEEIDGVGATTGPGLIGGLLVATMTGKAIAYAKQKPFFAVNHLEGHALTARLTDNVTFPYLLLLASGGHTQIILVRGVGDYERWATTIDDALGEAFDKTAKMLTLGFPGGPAVEKQAESGDPSRFDFPRPMQNHETLNVSLSGLKTAVRLAAEKCAPVTEQDAANLCASFQAAITDIIENRMARAMAKFRESFPEEKTPTLVVAGGVAANKAIRATLEKLCDDDNWQMSAPPLKLCTDNAAMIAWVAAERMALGETGEIDATPRPRWPLDEKATATVGHGKRGAKV